MEREELTINIDDDLNELNSSRGSFRHLDSVRRVVSRGFSEQQNERRADDGVKGKERRRDADLNVERRRAIVGTLIRVQTSVAGLDGKKKRTGGNGSTIDFVRRDEQERKHENRDGKLTSARQESHPDEVSLRLCTGLEATMRTPTKLVRLEATRRATDERPRGAEERRRSCWSCRSVLNGIVVDENGARLSVSWSWRERTWWTLESWRRKELGVEPVEDGWRIRLEG